MRILHGYRNLPADARGAVLAIGNFDGVHRGHQALLRLVAGEAARLARPAGAIVFEPHPREFFQPGKAHFRLTPLPRKLTLLGELGIAMAIVLDFDAELAGLDAEAFVGRVLVEGLAVRHVVIGYDFRYGKGRAGNPETMRAAGEALGFGVSVVDAVAAAGEVLSSSAIRAELAHGDVKAAARILGHWWRLGGTVIGGAKRGTVLGFPTANVRLPSGTALGHGIYAVFVHHDGQRHLAAAYLGTRPTFDDGDAVLEVFVFDFDGDLYGRSIEVEFIDFLRSDAKFPTAAALTAQIERDCAKARSILRQSRLEPPPL
jgi:riboflavin kinase/FMN adenylyltransferase